MPRVELVGGPLDGERRDVEQLLGRLEFHEKRNDVSPPNIGERLRRGERIPASELEFPGVILHVYSRRDPVRKISGAVAYYYVPQKGPRE